jgi:uncharacterized protein
LTIFSPISRRTFLRGGLAAAAVGSVALATDATFVEPDHPRLERVDIWLPTLPSALDGFTIAQLSDFHYDPYFSVTPIKAGIQMVNDLNPDLVVLTGDFVTMPFRDSRKHENRLAMEAADPCSEVLRALQAPHGVFAILGNHDHIFGPEGVTDSLQARGIQVLRNRSVAIEKDKRHFWLAGLDDVLGDGADLDETLRRIPPGETTVLLCHEPDFADIAALYGPALQISGHSHGGQVRLPLFGAPILPPLGRKYPWGWRRLGSMQLYTNCGIGTVNLPIRLNCPPEVTLFTLRSGVV